ncbi:hypothetical protein [Phormidium sp. CCY1219]|uniref:hypothetical protein n=1 Tax=Phormidium sp. CCY1219 TaxID=2886104 RepID=UPI002D1F57A2|nr:hypothetical protein [Phormidium sp. CCY1219]MEB3829780.1 hypothetical protein [Phormidium sp. CCY1219]
MKSEEYDLLPYNNLEPLNGSHHPPAPLSDDLLLIEWLENNPEYQSLVKRAKRQGWFWNLFYSLSPKPLILFLLGFVMANPTHFNGKAFAPRDLRTDSEITADLISGATLLNAITNMPLLFFAFKGIGNIWVAPIASFILNLIVLNWTNQSGTATANRKPGKKFWSRVGFAGFISMSLLQSFVAGIGAELINNRPALSYKLATELIEEHDRKVKAVQPNTEAYEKTLAQCEANREELETLDRSDPRWDSLYVETHGYLAERDRNWNRVPTENLPLCQKADRLRQETFAVRDEWHEKLKIRNQIGNDLIFLNRQLPLVYSQYFNEYGEITSGVEEVRLAYNNFFGNLLALDFSRLGFSLFFFLLSVITSLSACFIAVGHARGKNTQISHNPEVEAAIREWLENLRQQNLNRHRPNPTKEQRYQERLIGSFIYLYRQTGICDYPVVEEVAYRAHQGTLFLPEQEQEISGEIEQALEAVYRSVSAIESHLSEFEKFLGFSKYISRSDSQIESSIKSELKTLSGAITYLLDKAQKYAVDEYATSMAWDAEDPKKAQKLIKDIRKLWKDLNQHAHVNWLIGKPTEATRRRAYRKVRQKLDVLPGYCYELGYITQQKIKDKVAGNHFSGSKLYPLIDGSV